jgi:predicted secreted protein
MIKVGLAVVSLVTLGVMLGCHGCANGSDPPPQPAVPNGTPSAPATVPAGEVVLHVDDDGKAVDVARGSPVTLRLASNSGTGYVWTLTPVDTKVLALQGDRTSEIATEIPGGPKADVYRFMAVGAGVAPVEVALRRPFGDAPPARVVHFTVRVH